jgi:hypothetical protein
MKSANGSASYSPLRPTHNGRNERRPRAEWPFWQLMRTLIFRRDSKRRRLPEETRDQSRNDPGLDISFQENLVVLRSESDPRRSALQLTPDQWRTFREYLTIPGLDHINDGASRSETISYDRIRNVNDSNARSEDGGAANKEAIPFNNAEDPKNIYQLIKWLIQYANGNGKENRRFRTGMLVSWGLGCVTIFVIGTAVAIAHAGMPLIVGCSIGAGGAALLTLATALIGRFRRPKE